MKLIERKKYLDVLRKVKNTPDIKVITGVRRSGKSKLLVSFLKWVETNENNSNIIYHESRKNYVIGNGELVLGACNFLCK